MKITIDAGHGGYYPGCVSDKLYEKDIVLELGILLKEKLKENGHEVQLTRKEDNDIRLWERCQKANRFESDIFISLHINAHENKKPNGCETLYFPESEKGKILAECIQKELVKKLNCFDRGIKERGTLVVLKYTQMPAVLIEPLFLSNPKEKELIKQDYYKKAIVDSIAIGVGSYETQIKI